MARKQAWKWPGWRLFALGLAIAPFAFAFDVTKRAYEAWHFGPSNRLVGWFRRMDKRGTAWLEGLFHAD